MMRKGIAHTSEGNCGECTETSTYRTGVIACAASPGSARVSPSLQLMDPVYGSITRDPKFSELWIPIFVMISQFLHIDGLRGSPDLIHGRIYVIGRFLSARSRHNECRDQIRS